MLLDMLLQFWCKTHLLLFRHAVPIKVARPAKQSAPWRRISDALGRVLFKWVRSWWMAELPAERSMKPQVFGNIGMWPEFLMETVSHCSLPKVKKKISTSDDAETMPIKEKTQPFVSGGLVSEHTVSFPLSQRPGSTHATRSGCDDWFWYYRAGLFFS